MEHKQALAQLSDMSALQLADLVDAATPDSENSPGGIYLRDVAASVVSELDRAFNGAAVSEQALDSIREASFESAERVLTVYTHALWQTFIDLALYHNCEDEIIGDDMTNSVRKLCMLAGEKLVHALIDEYEQLTEME